MDKNVFTVTGMMSGTSMDGMDLALCRFWQQETGWHYEIVKAQTTAYSPDWQQKLAGAAQLSGIDLLNLHNQYGSYTGEMIRQFLAGEKEQPFLVASHGHTVFHQPERGITFQLGSGAAIAAACNITTVSDFRTLDVALGGQGAPLVPAGDAMLFGEYDYCLNLGGFANISFSNGKQRLAFDICPVNIVANALAQRKGYAYDRDGLIGSGGRLIPALVYELNHLPFYTRTGPRSLGREWVEEVFMPVLDKFNSPVEDLLRSVYEHIAVKLSECINAGTTGRVLVTGGGAFNTFLMDLLRAKSTSAIVIPDENVVSYKEALIFAFLGLLRFRNSINCLAAVTGARCDSSCGVVNRV